MALVFKALGHSEGVQRMELLTLAKQLTALVIYQIGTMDQSSRGNSSASYLWAGGSCC